MLPVAEKIRTKRREWNITQDELAQALGVTFQSVSRWENGAAYPDIELLPKIAAYFGITTDELLGADEETKLNEKNKRLSGYYEAFVRKVPDENTDDYTDAEKYEIAVKAFSEFGDRFYFAYNAAKLLVEKNIKPRCEALPLLRSIGEKVLENCRSSYIRERMLELIFIYEDEDKLSYWYKYGNSAELIIKRYQANGDNDRLFCQKQINLYLKLDRIFMLGLSQCDYRKYSPAESSIISEKKILEIIDLLRDESSDSDGWISQRAFTFLRLSAAYFAAGDKNNGYTALEKAAELYETMLNLPKGAVLGFDSPLLDTVQVSADNDFRPTGSLIYDSPTLTIENRDGVYEEIYRQNAPDSDMSRTSAFASIYNSLKTWKQYDYVRCEARFGAVLQKIEKYKPDNYDFSI